MHEAELPTETPISIIDDDKDFREAIARLMKSRGFTVEGFPSALAFLSCPNIRNTSCLIVDAHMPRMTGIELHRRLVESGYAIPTILISGYTRPLDALILARSRMAPLRQEQPFPQSRLKVRRHGSIYVIILRAPRSSRDQMLSPFPPLTGYGR
jgi:CheY-like chemotaxis protein